MQFANSNMIKDQSITNLVSMPFISDGNQSRESLNDVSSAALAQMSTQANLSVFKQKKARKARKDNETAPPQLSPKRSKVDIYQMDLGTMGIPREVAH